MTHPFWGYLFFLVKIEVRKSKQVIGNLFFLFLPFSFFFLFSSFHKDLVFFTPIFLCVLFLSNTVGFLSVFQEDKKEGFLESLFLFPGLSLSYLCIAKSFFQILFAGLPTLFLIIVIGIGTGLSIKGCFFLFLVGLLVLLPLSFLSVFFSALTLNLDEEFGIVPLILFPFYMPLCFFGGWSMESIGKEESIIFALLGILGVSFILIPLSLIGSVFTLKESFRSHIHTKGWEKW